MKRNNSRIRAMMILYNYDINQRLDYDNILHIIDQEEDTSTYEESFLRTLVDGAIEHIYTIDAIIRKNLENYTINRLSYVDRSLIRLAVFEMYVLKTPKHIVINEWLEISRIYTQIEEFDSVKFNNYLLDKIATYLETYIDER